MLFQGHTLQVQQEPSGILQLVFNHQHAAVNLLGKACLEELAQAVAIIQQQPAQGLIISSAKPDFILGADITEFQPIFQTSSPEQIIALSLETHKLFNSLEDLPYPTVSLLSGLALGGGAELALTTDYRLLTTTAQLSFPETKLGILPGWGACVRLPRLIGADNALEVITSAKNYSALEALKLGWVDALVEPENLQAAGLDLLHKANSGALNWQARSAQKKAPLLLSPVEQALTFATAKGLVAAKAGRHYPAPVTVVSVIEKSANLERAEAQQVEAQSLAKLAKTKVSDNLIRTFLNDQFLKRHTAQHLKLAQETQQLAVVGAGIMGGGIAYQAISKGVPAFLQDINPKALAQGISEASKLLLGQVERQRISNQDLAQALNLLQPKLDTCEFERVNFAIEAVVEDAPIKAQVLANLENNLPHKAILTSNTSTISITKLAAGLQRPENFCGLHFFNPVHLMHLVEVIYGTQTAPETVATAVALAQRLGKTPVVVKDCPGFLVNRILFPYFGGFNLLLQAGIDFRLIDTVMEKFGWPMGPAHLLDVVGLDTAAKANQVMAQGFPERMATKGGNVLETLFNAGRLGQKSGVGFYSYTTDKRGKPVKQEDASVNELLQPLVVHQEDLTAEQIIARLMVPLCLEAVRCLDEGIVTSAAEVDLALIYGLGFPPFLGGALAYIDNLGVAEFVHLADSLAHLGPLYQASEPLRARAAKQQKIYG